MTATVRPAIELDGEWRFVRDPQREHEASSLPDGEPISVPGCWEAQVTDPYRVVTAWYHRTIEIPSAWQDRTAVIAFGAVMYRCVVFLNGERVGSHEGGYTPFTIDLPHHLVAWGATNRVAVQVQNPMNALADYPAFAVEHVAEAETHLPELPLSEAPHGKQTWYSSQSGIWQSVRIEQVGAARFEAVTVEPDVNGSRAIVRWRLGETTAVRPWRVELTVSDPDGVEVGRSTALADAAAAEVPIPHPVLWDLDAPRLYRLEARLIGDGGIEDRQERRFGMRSVATQDGCVTLNGRPIYLLGVLDQDLYPDTISTPPSVEFLTEQLRRVKELGFNLIRCHIKVPDPAYLDAADEAGVLVWCELPNWSRFTINAAVRGRRTLERMVETMGHHPSVVIWTVINEDWGTRLRYEQRDRSWLRQTAEWLKELDPTRLVVDNSACETGETPNFHLRSDLADFHIYVGQDDPGSWRRKIAEFAERPAWLWSPHDDAAPVGDEPLVLSEFGGWGLPRLDRMTEHHGGDPWWFETGRGYYRPAGMAERFQRFGLDALVPTVDDLADATQWQQFEALQFQVAELRRHPSITGYVITELSDAYWEANGVLDPMRGPKVFHDRFREINAPDVVAIIPDRRDVWAGDSIAGEVFVSSYAGEPAAGGSVHWTLEVDAHQPERGELAMERWPMFGVANLGRLELATPAVSVPTDAWLTLTACDEGGRARAESRLRFAVLPTIPAGGDERTLAVEDPLDIWGMAQRVESIGHRIGRAGSADLVITAQLTSELLEHAEAGGRVLVLVRTATAIPRDLTLPRPMSAHLRRLPHEGWPGQRSPWEGDWVSSFSWIRPGVFPALPARTLLDPAYAEVVPDHVLLGHDPERHPDEVDAGMFVGWVHEPAALLWTVAHGAGSLTVTTLRVAPESGPVATTLLRSLIDHAIDPLASRRGTELSHA